jgi:hypothetical protein
MKYQNAALVLPLLAAIAAGCTTMGTGYGSTPAGGSPATFNWKSWCDRHHERNAV